LNVSYAKSPYTNYIKGKSTSDVRPNIIGHVSSLASWVGGEFDGVLIKYDGGNANISGGPGEAIGATVGFDAHNGNSSFGASETVQPPALLGLACIKF